VRDTSHSFDWHDVCLMSIKWMGRATRPNEWRIHLKIIGLFCKRVLLEWDVCQSCQSNESQWMGRVAHPIHLIDVRHVPFIWLPWRVCVCHDVCVCAMTCVCVPYPSHVSLNKTHIHVHVSESCHSRGRVMSLSLFKKKPTQENPTCRSLSLSIVF